MILDLTKADQKYVVINIDLIEEIEGFSTNPSISLSASHSGELSSTEKFKRILSVCLADEDHFPAERVMRTNHVNYLINYLRYYDKKVGFHADTIVVEKEYMSLSYLKDYSKYYSIGYNSYHKFCKRIHFFQKQITKADFQIFINSRDDENFELVKDIKSHYLGNVVAKPLPNSLIGSTLLRSYDEFYRSLSKHGFSVNDEYKQRNRKYFAIRPYHVNLFGQSISFESLVFQEQDRAVSACATVAIWMSLHKVNDLFGTPILAPSEITESAGLGYDDGRVIPNDGLDLNQIIKAIDNVQKNLVSEVFSAQSYARVGLARKNLTLKIIKPWKVKRYMYAYLRLQIPILLGYNLVRVNGRHLVTVTGYRFEKNTAELLDGISVSSNMNETNIKTVADRIVRLYSHDDQLGPFSKIGFDNTGFDNYLKVNWLSKENYELALAQIVIVPVIDFIRVSYNDIERFATKFKQFLKVGLFRDEKFSDLENSFIWDIYIIQSNDYKIELRNSTDEIVNKNKYQIQSFPQYIWIAGLRYQKSGHHIPLYDFIFDATDTPKSMNLFDVVYYNPDVMKQLEQYFGNESDYHLQRIKHGIFLGIDYLKKIKETLKKS